MLHIPDTGGDDQRLPQRMGVPGRACARLEGDGAATHPSGRLGLEQTVNPYAAREILGSALHRRLGADPGDTHAFVLIRRRLARLELRLTPSRGGVATPNA